MAGPFARINPGMYRQSAPIWDPPHPADIGFWYPFAADFTDAGPNGADGTPVGVQIAADPDGGGFNCLHSQSGTDRVEISGYSGVWGSTGYSFGGWIRPEGWGGGGYGRIIDNGSGELGQKTLVSYLNNPVISGSYLMGCFDNNNDSHSLVSPASTIQLGVWQHVFYTTQSGSQILYYNGVPINSSSETYSGLPSPTQTFYIANRQDLVRAWDGQQRQLFGYKRVLTESEINDIMNNT